VWQRSTGTSPAPRFDAGWTSIPLLPFIRQPTLIIAGTDDPIIPLAKLMSRLLPNATVHIHDAAMSTGGQRGRTRRGD
jgi:pimeloyl-ACP methyl ester carboxylesterase